MSYTVYSIHVIRIEARNGHQSIVFKIAIWAALLVYIEYWKSLSLDKPFDNKMDHHFQSKQHINLPTGCSKTLVRFSIQKHPVTKKKCLPLQGPKPDHTYIRVGIWVFICIIWYSSLHCDQIYDPLNSKIFWGRILITCILFLACDLTCKWQDSSAKKAFYLVITIKAYVVGATQYELAFIWNKDISVVKWATHAYLQTERDRAR